MQGSVSSLVHSTLQDWEAWLAPQVRAVELLGEIPISAEECQQLGKVVGLRACLPRLSWLGRSRPLQVE